MWYWLWNETAHRATSQNDECPGIDIRSLPFKQIVTASQSNQEEDDSSSPPFGTYLDAANCAGIDALHLAAYRALIAEYRGQMKSHTLYSEMLFNMSSERHISQALRTFGISKDTEAVIFATFDERSTHRLKDFIQGEQVPKQDIREHLNIEANEELRQRIIDLYSISPKELGVGSISEAVMSRLASKGLF